MCINTELYTGIVAHGHVEFISDEQKIGYKKILISIQKSF